MANDDPTKMHPLTDEAQDGAPGARRPRTPPTLDLAGTDVTPLREDAATADSLGDAEPPAAEELQTRVEPTDAPAAETPPAATTDTVAPGAAAPAARRMGVFGGLVAALVSGLIGGAVAVALVSSFYGAEDNIDAITDLEAHSVDLRQRIEVLEAKAGAVSDPAAAPAGAAVPDRLADRLDALEAGVGTLDAKVGALAAAPATPDVPAAVTDRIGALEQKIGALQPATPAASPEAVAALGTRIATLEQQLAAAAGAQRAGQNGAAQLVALGALREAILQGLPFADELKAARGVLGGQGDALAPLETQASTGFASGAALADRLKAAAASASEAAAASQDGLLDRLAKSASSLVTIRRADEAPIADGGDEGLLARAEAALRQGDFAAADRAIDAMSAAARAPLAPVAAAIDARQAALADIAGLNRRILGSLAGGTP